MRARTVGSVYCLPKSRVVHFEENRTGKKKSVRRIVRFHHSVYLFYRKHYTWGRFDPRAMFAATALTVRAAALVVGNIFLPVNQRTKAPLEAPSGDTRGIGEDSVHAR